jgi:hypothetical protein
MNAKRSLIALMVLLALPTLAAEPERGDEVTGGRRTADGENPAVNTSPEAAPQRQTPETGDAEPSSPSAVRRPPVTVAPGATDRLELDTSIVTGNRELPKVLYIVPWKKADLGELPGQPFNTLLDEVLMPVDRDVFRREVTYFEAVTEGADATQSTSPSQQ